MVKIDPYKHKEKYIKWKKESKKGEIMPMLMLLYKEN